MQTPQPQPQMFSHLPTMSYLKSVLYNQRLQMMQLAMLKRRFVYPMPIHAAPRCVVPPSLFIPTVVPPTAPRVVTPLSTIAPPSLKRKASSQGGDDRAKRAQAQIDQKIQNMQLQQALYEVESQKYVKVMTNIKLHESEGVIKTFREIQYPHLIDGKPVKLVLILFEWGKEWVWTVNNTNFTAPFCSMNQGNTNRKAQELKEYADKVIIQSKIVYATHTRKQKSLVLTSLGVQKMCNRYQHYQPAYVAWIRECILPLLLIHVE